MSSPANLKHPSEGAAIGAQVAKAVAWVSGVFSLVACISLIVNQIQIMQVDPLNDATLKALKAQIPKDLNNQQLRESVRNLSFMTRRSFFTNQTMMRATGLMLLFGVAIFLASIKTYVELRLKLPVPQGQAPREGGAAERASYRWAVGAGAGLVVVLTLLLVFISPPDFDLMKEDKPEVEKAAAAPSEAKASETKPEAKPAASTPLEAAPPGTKPAEPKPAAPAPDGGPKAPASAAAAVPAGAWPAFRGPQGLGTAPHRNAPLTWSADSVLWKKPIPKAGTNSPIVWGDQVFIAGADEQSRDLYCYSARTGDLLWTAAFTLVTGVLPKIMAEATYCPATLTTDGERVYGVFATGDVVACGLDGKTAWRYQLPAFKNSYGHSSSLLAAGGLVLVQFDHEAGGKLIALDARKGKVRWEQPRTVKSSWASPILIPVEGRTQVVLCGNPLVTGHDPETGKILWQFNWMEEKSGEVAPSPCFAGGRLFVGTQGVPLVALRPGASDVKKLWEYEGEIPDASSPVATEKHVFVAAGSGVVTCIDAATGKMVWTHDFDDGFNSSPLVVDDRVYLSDKKGNTVVFKAGDKYEQLALNSLGEPFDATPAIPEGRIYLRSLKNLYCIGKDAR